MPHARNKIIVRKESCFLTKLGEMIIGYIKNVVRSDFLYFSKRDPSIKIQKKNLLRLAAVWTSPPEECVKMNFDGSTLSNGQNSYGFVIRNSNGEIFLRGLNYVNPSNSIVVVDAWGSKRRYQRSFDSWY